MRRHRLYRPEASAFREPTLLDVAVDALELLARERRGRCFSCAARLHHCEGDGCNCPLPRCDPIPNKRPE